MPDLLATQPYFEKLVMEDEHPDGKVGFVCSTCNQPVHDRPCPDHAPREIPGLDLVECEATPRHWAWVLASDANGYGIPCFRCIVDQQAAERRAAEACRCWGWRRWGLTHWLAGKAYTLGIISSGGSWVMGNGHEGCMTTLPRFNWRQRPYILGVPRETWRCWLVGHHRRGEEVGLGFCGKCLPWPCCGSQVEAHAPGCPEDR